MTWSAEYQHEMHVLHDSRQYLRRLIMIGNMQYAFKKGMQVERKKGSWEKIYPHYVL
jgi:hypothetical protein